MFTPLTRALDQLADPAILRVLLTSLALSALCFVFLCVATFTSLHHALLQTGWLAWVAGIAGGFAAGLAALWLYLPVAVVIASLFMEPVCRAVERHWYPHLAQPTGASFAAQIWDSIMVGLLVLALSIVSLVLAVVIPGIGLVLGWAITAWALGRGFFVAVAMRRMDRPEAALLYRQHRNAVLLQGAALALMGYIPLVNLLMPVLGPACMIHVLMSSRPLGESWG